MEAYKEQKINQENKGTTNIKTINSNNIDSIEIKNNNIKNCVVTNEQEEKTEINVKKDNKIVEIVECKEKDSKTKVFPDLEKVSENKTEAKLLVRRPCSVTASIFASTEAKLKYKYSSNITNNKYTTSATKSIADQTSSVAKILSHPQNATSKIFAPRTGDMNKGFLTFADGVSGLTSK